MHKNTPTYVGIPFLYRTRSSSTTTLRRWPRTQANAKHGPEARGLMPESPVPRQLYPTLSTLLRCKSNCRAPLRAKPWAKSYWPPKGNREQSTIHMPREAPPDTQHGNRLSYTFRITGAHYASDPCTYDTRQTEHFQLFYSNGPTPLPAHWPIRTPATNNYFAAGFSAKNADTCFTKKHTETHIIHTWTKIVRRLSLLRKHREKMLGRPGNASKLLAVDIGRAFLSCHRK